MSKTSQGHRTKLNEKGALLMRMFSHSRMSVGREFQVDGAATENARWASSVYVRNDQQRSIGIWMSAEPEVVHGSVPAR